MLPILPIILSGGSVSRPVAAFARGPFEQFLPLAGDYTMLQAAWKRVTPVAGRPPLR